MARGQKKESLTPEERLQAALVPENEQPYNVPGNWCWTRLGSLGYTNIGLTYKPSDKSETGTIVLRSSNIQDGKIDYSDIVRVNISIPENKMTHKGDILICARNGSKALVGKTALVDMDGMSYGAFMAIFRSPYNNIVFYYLNSPYFRDIIDRDVGTTTINQVTQNLIKELPFPLPPLSEQQRIVDRIESLFAKLDEAKQKAQDALDSFETRKAAILHKAFTGELTAQWRKEHGVGMESWGRLQWGSFIVSIEAGKNWSAEGRPPQADEFGVVKVSAVTWGEFNEVESKTCTVEEQWNENIQIHEGDFLFSRANTLQLVGNCVIVKSISRRLMLSDKILRFKFDKRVIPEYVLHFTRSNLYRNQIEQLASGNQDGMRNVSQKNMKLVEFPIPKLEEQKEIVRILGDLLAKEEQAKEVAEGVLEQIVLIKKAILARAFRGELGTNDPSEESAVELLKRVPAGEPTAKTRANAVCIPREVEEQLKSELERKIIKSYYYSDSQSLPIDTLMEVSSKKFELLESIRNLEQRGIIKKLSNGNYKLVR